VISIFDYDDYKTYLQSVEVERSKIAKGFRARMAEALGVQSAFISQVLNTNANFSLEQALKCARLLELNEPAENYFLTLVNSNRAGTPELKAHYDKQLAKLRQKHLNIATHVGARNLSPEASIQYYSQWYYAAIHILVTIPKFRTTDEITKVLGLNKQVVEKAVMFLVSNGLLTQEKGKLVPGETQLHLSKDSKLVFQKHQNWRLRAIESLTSESFNEDFHYSTVSSLSQKDVQKIKSMLLEVVEKYVATVKPSKEEELFAFTVDFFDLTKK
jgi:uncharacterized protein (TIGR02147 family)